MGTALDEGDVKPVLQHIIETQIRAYSAVGKWTYKDGFFTQLQKPLSDTRFTLMTSSGHFVAGDDPQPFGVPHMTQNEAIKRIDDFLRVEPTLSAMTLPRVLTTPHPLGRPLGKPHDRKRHKSAVLAALTLLAEAKQVGEVIELPGLY